MREYLIPIVIIGLIVIASILAFFSRKWTRFDIKNYYAAGPLLTQREKYLFGIIERMNMGKCFAKVRVADIITTRRREYRYSNKITQKHIDILIVDTNYTPIIAIEIQDNSHYKANRMTRDRFIKRIFTDAKIPLVFIRGNDPEKIRYVITNALNKKLT